MNKPPVLIGDISPDDWSRCPVCGQVFAQTPGAGRRRVYCSRSCKQKEFRNGKSVTKLTREQVQQALAVGHWQALDRWPAWPRYRCLVCHGPIGETTPARVDRFSWDQLNGVYRRLICEQCIPPERKNYVKN